MEKLIDSPIQKSRNYPAKVFAFSVLLTALLIHGVEAVFKLKPALLSQPVNEKMHGKDLESRGQHFVFCSLELLKETVTRIGLKVRSNNDSLILISKFSILAFAAPFHGTSQFGKVLGSGGTLGAGFDK